MSSEESSISSSDSSDSSDCADGGCKIETQRENADGTCPAGYDNKYTFYLNGGSPMKMCAKCIGVDKCKAGEKCTFEKFTETKFGMEIKHARCVCKNNTSSSEESSYSSEESSSSSEESSYSSSEESSYSSESSAYSSSEESSWSSIY